MVSFLYCFRIFIFSHFCCIPLLFMLFWSFSTSKFVQNVAAFRNSTVCHLALLQKTFISNIWHKRFLQSLHLFKCLLWEHIQTAKQEMDKLFGIINLKFLQHNYAWSITYRRLWNYVFCPFTSLHFRDNYFTVFVAYHQCNWKKLKKLRINQSSSLHLHILDIVACYGLMPAFVVSHQRSSSIWLGFLSRAFKNMIFQINYINFMSSMIGYIFNSLIMPKFTLSLPQVVTICTPGREMW